MKNRNISNIIILTSCINTCCYRLYTKVTIVLMDEFHTCPNGPHLSCGSILVLVQTEHIIDYLKEALMWNKRWILDKSSQESFCVSPPGHPDRSGQLCNQPVLWLPAIARRCRTRRRICARLRQEDGPQWMVKTRSLALRFTFFSLPFSVSNQREVYIWSLIHSWIFLFFCLTLFKYIQ